MGAWGPHAHVAALEPREELGTGTCAGSGVSPEDAFVMIGATRAPSVPAEGKVICPMGAGTMSVRSSKKVKFTTDGGDE